MRKFAQTLSLILFIAPGAAFAQEDAAPDPAVYEDPAAWSRDIEALYNEIRTVHPDYDVRTSAEVWQSHYDAFQAEIPSLDWAGFVTATAQFMELAQDGHTNVFPFAYSGPGFEEAYPLRAYLFGDQLYLTRVSESARELAGGRVISIGGVPAEDVSRSLMGLIGAGSPMWKVNFAPVLLRYPGFASALGYGDADGGITLTVETPNGETVTATLRPLAEDAMPELVTAFDVYNPQAAYPRWMVEEAPYVYEYLPEENAVYLIYGAVTSDEEDPIDEFAARMFQFIEDNNVERLIIDVRNNGGGDNTYNAPFVHGVIASHLNHPGGVYVLTGRQTFSAAQNFSNWMERHTQAIFVGEPTAGRPNHFGDAEVYPLPESGVVTLISTLRWQDSFDSDPRPWIRPDVAATMSFDDFLHGRDPALEAALHHDASDIPFQPFTARRWHRDTQFLGWDVPLIGMRGVYDPEGNEVQ